MKGHNNCPFTCHYGIMRAKIAFISWRNTPMMSKSRKRKLSIIIAWILFLIILNGIFLLIEKNLYDRTAKKELVEEAYGVRRQLPSIVESDYFTQSAEIKIHGAKLRSLAFAMKDYESISDAEPLLDDFYTVAGIEGIDVFDRDGNVLYSRGINQYRALYEDNAEAVTTVLDTEIYGLIYALLGEKPEYTDEDIGYLLATNDSSIGVDYYFWGVDNRWLVSISDIRNKSQDYVQRYLARNRALQNISIGKGGFLIVLDKEENTVISSPVANLEGQPISVLEMTKDKEITSVDQLLELFTADDDTIRMEIHGFEYYAHLLDYGNAVILVVMPITEIAKNVSMTAIVMIILVALISGLGVLYAVFHTDDPGETEDNYKGHFILNRSMSGKMKIISVLCVVGVFVGVVYLEALSIYADTFDYSQSKVAEVVEMLDENEVALNQLHGWSDAEALTRGRIAKCILDHADPAKVDFNYLMELSECLGVTYIYRFDKDGKVVVTNSPYDQFSITQGSDLYPLVEGKPELVLPPAEDQASGLYLQNAGIAIKDEENRSNGFVMVSLYPEEVLGISENLGFEYVFDQLGLTSGSYVVAVNDADMRIAFIACMNDDSLDTDIAEYDYIGLKITDLGIKENVLRDNFNGNVLLFDNTYFASIRRVDDIYYIVMRPRVSLSASNIIPALLYMVLTMLFMGLLVVMSSVDDKSKKHKGPEQETEQETEETANKSHHDGDVISMLGRMINKQKPYFEDRWPNEIRKWKDRTPEEKFSSASQYMVLYALLLIFIIAKVTGERSIWYYCITGKWENGINLYSITSCVMSICLLLVIKILIHKILFLTARASSARGETICHLTDNFSGYALVIVGIFLCLHHVGVNTKALSLTGGVAGVIFGIGCQNIVADILAGVIMAFGGEVHVGDFISYNGKYGVVLSIGIRTTKLKWFGEVTMVRNNEFKNYAFITSNEQNRVTCELYIDLKESLERVEKILEAELPGIQERLTQQIGDPVNGPVYRGVSYISQDCVALSFYVLCKGMYFAAIGRMLNGELKKMCERNNINLAMHQVVVNEPEKYSQKTAYKKDEKPVK